MRQDFKKEEKGDTFTITFASLSEAVSAKRHLHRYDEDACTPCCCKFILRMFRRLLAFFISDVLKKSLSGTLFHQIAHGWAADHS